MKLLARLSSGGSKVSLLALRIVSGRTHQIRAHLAALGHPVVGDQRYAADGVEVHCLHRYRVAFRGLQSEGHEVVEPLPRRLRSFLEACEGYEASMEPRESWAELRERLFEVFLGRRGPGEEAGRWT